MKGEFTIIQSLKNKRNNIINNKKTIMTLDEFIKAFAAEFDDTPEDVFKADTHFRELDEWSSLTALSIISMVDDNADVVITGADIRSCTTIEDLYNIVQSK